MERMDDLSKIVAILVLVLLSDQAFAGVYKWTDETGQVHYGERPPETPADVNEITVEGTPPSAANAEERLLQYQKEWGEAMEDRVKRKREQARTEKKKEVQKKNCTTAKSRLSFYSRQHRIFHTGEDGEREYVNDQQRAAAREQAQNLVNKWCQ